MRGVVAVALALWVTAAQAHDFWIDPSTYRPEAGSTVDVVLRLGHGRDARTVARDDGDIEQFVVVAGDRVVPVGGAAGSDPAGRVVLPVEGCSWVAYRSGRSFSALAPARFSEYLERRGLEHVAADRHVRGESERYGVEVYSRCAKALLNGPGCDGSIEARRQMARPVGLTLEIVLEANPGSSYPGDRLPVRVLFRDEPLAGLLVEAVPDGDRTRAARVRADADGRAEIPLRHGGRWVLSAVYMERAVGPERAEWESWWASLSFELHGARWRELRFDRRRFIPGVPVPTRPPAR